MHTDVPRGAEIADAELIRLQSFVDNVFANYDYSGVEETRIAE